MLNMVIDTEHRTIKMMTKGEWKDEENEIILLYNKLIALIT